VIRTNLSTRPFYNERAVHFWLLVVALLVVGATVFNVTRVLRYSRSDTQLATQAGRDEGRAADLRRQATSLRATVDPRQIEYASTEARQANELIDRRTFSWTELLNRFETTLPDEVRVVALKPTVEKNGDVTLTINVVSRNFEDIEKFMDNLDATKAFIDVHPSQDQVNEQGLTETTLETRYVPSTPQPASAPPAAKAGEKRR
jgi:type IV pilus assembly protein PilN